MRIVISGSDTVVGRLLAARLRTAGHHVDGDADLRGADVVVHCTGLDGPDDASLAQAVDAAVGVGRFVFAYSGPRRRRDEQLLRARIPDAVICRSGLVLGRDLGDGLVLLLARRALPAGGGSPLSVVHVDDVLRILVEAVVDPEKISGTIEFAAPDPVTPAEIAEALGRSTTRTTRRDTLAQWFLGCPVLDAAQRPIAWSAPACLADTALAVRGRIAIGGRVWNAPWRLPRVRTADIPAVDCPASDGVLPVFTGPVGGNGEFDTPIDPRFPAFVATNLSEALPGPFTPSSASVTVLGARAGGVTIARQLRPGGVVEREIAARTVGVFGHRLYAAVTSAHFMAQTVPFTDPMLVLGQFFGRTVHQLPIFGSEAPPAGRAGMLAQLRNVGVFGGNLVGLSAGSVRDTRDFVADVDSFESEVQQYLSVATEPQLADLIRRGRDLVVYGWVLASASIMLCSAYSVLLRLLTGRDTTPPAGPEVASARSVDAIRRLAAIARRDPEVAGLLHGPVLDLAEIERRAPAFHRALTDELHRIGHRGPAEVEMSSPTYADDPALLLRIVTRTLDTEQDVPPEPTAVAPHVRPVAALAARQLRDREDRRDKMVRAIWLLRRLLREKGRRMTAAGVLADPEDVFYLLVDELDTPLPDAATSVARRRAEQARLTAIVPPPAFSGRWEAQPTAPASLTAGTELQGLGICGGRVRGRVRVVRPDTIDDLQPGEVLVAEVTDVGYTPAFGYAAAVVTELGGPMSHAAVVAREFGFPCVVDARGATRLSTGTLIEVDGATGAIYVLDA
ncbi:hypothetical protein EB72_24195 [Mycobacterium sp. SWH-M1]|nr:hypothetical protein EB72_24195 [Mycobacterium sp. SWH-M1]